MTTIVVVLNLTFSSILVDNMVVWAADSPVCPPAFFPLSFLSLNELHVDPSYLKQVLDGVAQPFISSEMKT